MGRGRARGMRSGGGGMRSSSGKFFGRGPIMSPSQQQDHLIQQYPGVVYLIARPKSKGCGSGSLIADKDEFPYDNCKSMVTYYYDAVRVCGSDCDMATSTRYFLNELCGLEVKPGEFEKGDVTDAAAAARL